MISNRFKIGEDYPCLPPPTFLEVVDQQLGFHESGNENFDSPSYIQTDSPDTAGPSHTHQDMDAPSAQWLPSPSNNLGLPVEGTRNTLLVSSKADDGSTDKFCPDASFYLQNHNVEVDDQMDIHHLPPYELALELVQRYLKQIHEWLPIIPQDFENQVRIYYAESQAVSAEWLAILNLVFAIGTRHRFLLNAPRGLGEDQQREEVMYMSRAIRLLRPRSANLLTSSPDLPLVQVRNRLPPNVIYTKSYR